MTVAFGSNALLSTCLAVAMVDIQCMWCRMFSCSHRHLQQHPGMDGCTPQPLPPAWLSARVSQSNHSTRTCSCSFRRHIHQPSQAWRISAVRAQPSATRGAVRLQGVARSASSSLGEGWGAIGAGAAQHPSSSFSSPNIEVRRPQAARAGESVKQLRSRLLYVVPFAFLFRFILLFCLVQVLQWVD